jgi:hypothetical protein
MAIDTADDDLWIATFGFKDGTKRQYKTSRNDMVSYCSKHYVRSAYIENNKGRLVRTWKRCAIKLCVRELDITNLNKRITDDSRGVRVILDVTHCDEMDREAEFRKEFLDVNTYDNPLV